MNQIDGDIDFFFWVPQMDQKQIFIEQEKSYNLQKITYNPSNKKKTIKICIYIHSTKKI